MKQESKDRFLEMIKMRLDGCTYKEIAEKFGVTRQRVQQIVAEFTGKERTKKSFNRTGFIYPNILEWMDEKGISLAELSRIIGIGEGNSSRTSKKCAEKPNLECLKSKKFLKKAERHLNICLEQKMKINLVQRFSLNALQ